MSLNKVLRRTAKDEELGFNLIIEFLRLFFAIEIMFTHIYRFNFNYLDSLLDKTIFLVDFFFVISGFVLYPIYERKFNRKNKISDFTDFAIKRARRFLPNLLIILFLNFSLFKFEEFMEARGYHQVIVYPEWDLTKIFLSVLMLQMFFAGPLNLLPLSWSVSAEYYSNLFYMFKKTFNSNMALITISILSFVAYVILYKFDVKIDPNAEFGTNHIPALFKGINGIAVGFLARRNLARLRNFRFTKFSILILIILYFLPYMDLALLVSNVAFGLFLVYITQWDFDRESILGRVSYLGGAIAYSMYLTQQFAIDVVNYITNQSYKITPLGFKFVNHDTPPELILRFLSVLFISFFVSFFVEKVSRKIAGIKPIYSKE